MIYYERENLRQRETKQIFRPHPRGKVPGVPWGLVGTPSPVERRLFSSTPTLLLSASVLEHQTGKIVLSSYCRPKRQFVVHCMKLWRDE